MRGLCQTQLRSLDSSSGSSSSRKVQAPAEESSPVSMPHQLSDLFPKAGPPRGASTSDDSVVQMKLVKHQNPVLASEKIPEPSEGGAKVLAAARTIDVGLEEGASTVRRIISDFYGGMMTSDEVAEELQQKVSSGHISSFVHHLGDGEGQKMLAADAGYIIEGFADAVAPTNVSTQARSGGARPDYDVLSGEVYAANGESIEANGYVDATSAAEATKGHISEKVTRVLPGDGRSHPHLYDCFYEDLNIPGGQPTPHPDEASSEIRMAREAELANRVKMREERQQSLRSGGPMRRRDQRSNPRAAPY